ncbi:MAG: hypothetical protein JWO10_1317 [Microbacteriaceae bacterium]|nr:hypothetical protein [Microbacteriaceae bacterium]
MALTLVKLLTGAAVVALGAAAVLASTASVEQAQAVTPTTQGLEYVALGDSYSAGFGLTPLTASPVPGCLQSSSNYPHQLAAALGMNLTDVTCSGATTANIFTTPQDTGPLPFGGVAPIQLSALSASTDVVTISIGGNDLGFAAVAASCFALGATGPVYDPPTFPADCRSKYVTGTSDALENLLNAVVTPALANTFAQISAAAPNAKVFVVSYPSIFPDAANTPAGPQGCFTSAVPNGFQPPFGINSFPFTLTDVSYLHGVEQSLDGAIHTVADAAGFTYVNDFDLTLAHSACATTGAYVNGITVESLSLSPASVTLAPGALHPNQLGVDFMTAQVLPAIVAAFPAPSPDPGPTLSPAPEPAAQLAATGTSVVPAVGIAALLALVGILTVVSVRRLRVKRD